jgi:hypothetical protein
MGIRAATKAFFSDDPWALLRLFRIYNFTPIRHEPNTRHPVRFAYMFDGTFRQIGAEADLPEGASETVDAFIVDGRAGKTLRRKKVEYSEPLGAEDYELGVKAEAISDRELEEHLIQDGKERGVIG